MTTRVIMLSPEVVRETLVFRAGQEICRGIAYFDVSVELVTQADGVAAVVTFKDRGAPAPASMPPVERTPRKDCPAGTLCENDGCPYVHDC